MTISLDELQRRQTSAAELFECVGNKCLLGNPSITLLPCQTMEMTLKGGAKSYHTASQGRHCDPALTKRKKL